MCAPQRGRAQPLPPPSAQVAGPVVGRPRARVWEPTWPLGALLLLPGSPSRGARGVLLSRHSLEGQARKQVHLIEILLRLGPSIRIEPLGRLQVTAGRCFGRSQYQHLPFHPLGRNEHLVRQVECTPQGNHIPRTQHHTAIPPPSIPDGLEGAINPAISAIRHHSGFSRWVSHSWCGVLTSPALHTHCRAPERVRERKRKRERAHALSWCSCTSSTTTFVLCVRRIHFDSPSALGSSHFLAAAAMQPSSALHFQ
jgi:hypothetical protein